MEIIKDYDNLKIPSYALSYLFNDDVSGLEEDDIQNICQWYKKFINEAKKVNGHIIIDFMKEDDEGYFTSNPEFGLACTVIDCKLLIVK